MDATFSGTNIFTVADNRTAEFVAGRRIKADCVSDGYVYASVVSSSYSDPNTVVTIDENGLTSNLITVLYGVVEPGSTGSLPDHDHGESEGSGGEITTHDHDGSYYTESELDAGQLDNRYYTETEVDTISGSLSSEIDSDISTHSSGGNHDDIYYTETEIDTMMENVGVTTFSGLSDTPATYDEGKLPQATTSGLSWSDFLHTGNGVPEEPATYSGVDGLYLLTDSTPVSAVLTTGKTDLVDGNKTTSVTAQITNNHSFGIDLSVQTQIEYLDVYGYLAAGVTSGEWQANYDEMSVYGSNDNSSWTKIGDTYTAPPVYDYILSVSRNFRTRLDFSTPQTYRYFKVTGNDTLYFWPPSRAVSWCEIEGGVSASLVGSNGDWYWDLSTGDIYKKSSDTWAYVNNITSLSAPLSHLHSDIYYTETEVDTIVSITSGTLQTQIDNIVEGKDFGGHVVASGVSSTAVQFSSNQEDENYYVTMTLINLTDVPPTFYNYAVTDTTVSGFTVSFSDTIDTGNYILDWHLMR